MIFVQKLPSLEPEMRCALRSHIIRKRQRLKQELEQDAIERRLKREKELKQLQDAMTLDQIKEQLRGLEKKLETLRDEKHHLFVQLKQVLNEDNTRRKSNEDQKKQNANIEIATTTTAQSGSSTPQTTTTTITSNGASHELGKTFPMSLSNRNQELSTSVSLHSNVKVSSPINQRIPPPVPPPIPPPATLPRAPLHQTPLIQSGPYNNNSFIRTPLPPPIPQSPYNMAVNIPPGHSLSSSQLLNSDTIHTPFNRIPLASQQTLPHDLMAAGLLDFGHPGTFQAQQLGGNRPLMMDVPLSLATNHHDMKLLGLNNKRPLSVAGLNETHLDDRNNLMRKKTNTSSNGFAYANPTNQFLLNSVPPHGLPHSLAQFNQLNQTSIGLPQTSIGIAPVTSSASGLIQGHFSLRKPLPPPHQLATNFNYMMSQEKSGLMMPDLNSFYQTVPAPLIPPSPLYPAVDKDLKQFTAPYPSSLARQYSSLSRTSNPQPLYQSELNPRYLATNINYSGKTPHLKSPYQSKK